MSEAIVLINSGAYVEPELRAEFGPLPPAFLPVGLQRLYELQARALAPLGAELVLTLPESMALPDWDAARLKALGVTVLRSPDRLSLGQALMHTLASLGFDSRPLRMLHGDTLVSDTDLGAEDAVCVTTGSDGYRWGHVREEDGRVVEAFGPDKASGQEGLHRLAGYYALSDSVGFARALALTQGDFFGALTLYARTHDLAAVRPETWLDFGHVQTFFRSRRLVTTARAFNQLEISETAVRKRSLQREKLQAEARWLKSAPAPLQPYVARLLDEGEDAQGYFYDTEYRSTPTLAELLVFGELNAASWQRILGACRTFMDAAVAVPVPEGRADALRELVVEKTRARLELFAREVELDLDAPNTLDGRPAPSLRACVDRIEALVADDAPRPAVMHGDFCFSNILYDFRTERIQVIDPRGLLADGTPSLYGDARYDAAKLMHSITGRYDLIVAGRFQGGRIGANAFTLSFPPESLRPDLERAAAACTMGGVPLGSSAVAAITASLFLSMAPLHADRPDRQFGFIANALRLMLELESRT